MLQVGGGISNVALMVRMLTMLAALLLPSLAMTASVASREWAVASLLLLLLLARGPRLQHEPSLHHRMAKPRMGSRCRRVTDPSCD